ncbi:MAG: hypothetical protein JWP02_1086, partial [Acidimicrobiales bacterium]|nr:hypothetical protein [Acidimicrobiales bacterium]
MAGGRSTLARTGAGVAGGAAVVGGVVVVGGGGAVVVVVGSATAARSRGTTWDVIVPHA